jgi:hypothetical protein
MWIRVTGISWTMHAVWSVVPISERNTKLCTAISEKSIFSNDKKKCYLLLFRCDYSRMELLITYVHSYNTAAINQILCFRQILYREWDKNKSVHQPLCKNSLANYGRHEFWMRFQQNSGHPKKSDVSSRVTKGRLTTALVPDLSMPKQEQTLSLCSTTGTENPAGIQYHKWY